jgi:hypothetical protein
MSPGYIVFFAVAAMVLSASAVQLRVLIAAKKRSGATEGEFVAALAARGIPEDVGRAVFEGFHKWGSCIADDFPLTPSLTLREFAPFVEYDETEVIAEILSKTGRYWPRERLLPWLPGWTLHDLARFVANCPRNA